MMDSVANGKSATHLDFAQRQLLSVLLSLPAPHPPPDKIITPPPPPPPPTHLCRDNESGKVPGKRLRHAPKQTDVSPSYIRENIARPASPSPHITASRAVVDLHLIIAVPIQHAKGRGEGLCSWREGMGRVLLYLVTMRNRRKKNVGEIGSLGLFTWLVRCRVKTDVRHKYKTAFS